MVHGMDSTVLYFLLLFTFYKVFLGFLFVCLFFMFPPMHSENP